jgi:FKBP-type peptidyl-prolyl cis-trans isomerase
VSGQQGGPPPVASQPVAMPSGLQYIEVVAGTGDEASVGQRVTVHYTGWLTNGTKFDKSHTEGRP